MSTKLLALVATTTATILVTAIIIQQRRFITDTVTDLIAAAGSSFRSSAFHESGYLWSPSLSGNFDQFRIFSPTNKIIRPTSFWCGTPVTGGGHCRYESLCYRKDSREFVFLLHRLYSTRNPPEPEIYGRLSPVVDHNRFLVRNLVTVPWEEDAGDQVAAAGKIWFWIPGQTVIMARFKPDNLLHLFHDDLLPLLATIREYGPFHHVFFDDHWPDTVGHFLFPPGMIRLNRDRLPNDSMVCFEQAFIGISDSTLWYQYGFKKPQSSLPRTPEQLDYIRSHMAILRTSLLKQLNLNQEKCHSRHTLLMARRETRRILNVDRLSRYLGLRWPRHPVHLVWVQDHGYLNDQRQFRRLAAAALCAQNVVAMHGSELMATLFVLPPETTDSEPIRIIELFPYGVSSNISTVYKTMAETLLYQYHCWTNSNRNNTKFPNDNDEHGGLGHVEPETKKRIQDSVDQPLGEFLCCDNPEWLYRIYQDTVVDPEDLDRVLNQDPQTQERRHRQPVFRLGEVRPINCTFDEQNRMTIHWQPPWNLEMADITVSKFVYEIAIQLPSSSNKIIKTTSLHHERQLTLTLDDCLSFGCYVWIKLNFENGSHSSIWSFYNRVPLFCIK